MEPALDSKVIVQKQAIWRDRWQGVKLAVKDIWWSAVGGKKDCRKER